MAAQLKLTDPQKELLRWMVECHKREPLPFHDVTTHDTTGGDLEVMHKSAGFTCYQVDIFELIDKGLVSMMPNNRFRVTNLGVQAVEADMI